MNSLKLDDGYRDDNEAQQYFESSNDEEKFKTLIATDETLMIAQEIKRTRDEIKRLKAREEKWVKSLGKVMGEHDRLISITHDGEEKVHLTWQRSKDSESFDKVTFRKHYEELYQRFIVITKGSRRLLIK